MGHRSELTARAALLVEYQTREYVAMRPRHLLWHCGWCRPLSKWQAALYPLGIRWTTGMCSPCLEQERHRRAARRATLDESPHILQEATG